MEASQVTPDFVHGAIAPVFSSFNEDGSFNEAGQRNFLDFLLERGGVSAFFVRSGMGQMYTFSYEDVQAMAHTACGHLQGKAPILVGTSGVWDRNRQRRPDPAVFTRQAVELSAFAEQAGSTAVVHTIPEAIAPKDGQTVADVVLEYFDTVSRAVTCPIFIYQPPGTAEEYQVTVDLVQALADMPRLAGIKASTNDAQYIHDIAWAVHDRPFAVISGAETAFLAGLASGTKAVIGQGSTVNPQILAAIQDRFEAGDLQGAREAQWATNYLVEESSNATEFMKRYATENGFEVPPHSRHESTATYGKARPPALTTEEYDRFKTLLETELARYVTS